VHVYVILGRAISVIKGTGTAALCGDVTARARGLHDAPTIVFQHRLTMTSEDVEIPP
jgi:hypothetical protein